MPKEATLTITLTHEEWGEVVNALSGKSCLVKRGDYDPEEKPGANAAWCAALDSAYEKMTTVLDVAKIPY